MPFAQAIGWTSSLADGELGLGDFTGGVDFGLEVLNAVLDPINCLVGQALDFLLRPLVDWGASQVPVLDSLWGGPEQITTYSDNVRRSSASLAAAANAVVDSADDIPSWTGPGADTYRQVLRDLHSTMKGQSEATAQAAGLLQGIAAVAAMVREVLWSMIKEALADLITKGLMALASMIPSFGASIGAYMSFMAAKYAVLMGKVSLQLSKAFRWLAKIAEKLGPLGRILTQIADKLASVASRQFGRAGGLTQGGNQLRNNPSSINNPGRQQGIRDNVPDLPNSGVPNAGATQVDSSQTSGNPSESIRDFPA